MNNIFDKYKQKTYDADQKALQEAKKIAYAIARKIVQEQLNEGAEIGNDQTNLIKKIAIRVLPKIQDKVLSRTKSFVAGSPMKNHGKEEHREVSEDFNKMFVEYFGSGSMSTKWSTTRTSKDDDANSMGTDPQPHAILNGTTPKGPVKVNMPSNKGGPNPHVEFRPSDKPSIDDPQKQKLSNLAARKTGGTDKVAKLGVTLEAYTKVFQRGLNEWHNGMSHTPEQYAFARVHSFINKGKSWRELDADLAEAFKNWTHEFNTGDKTKVLSGPNTGTRATIVDKHEGGNVYSIKYPNGDVRKHHISTLEIPNDVSEETAQEETFKRGDTVYLKTKKFANSPHTGRVDRVTSTHVHIRTLGGSGMYKAPLSAVTKDRNLSHLHTTYGNKTEETELEEKRGLWDNIHDKRERIKAGSGERMRKPGSKGAPTAQNFKDASESIEESKNTPYVKPHTEVGSTKQIAWKASNKHGKVKYFGLEFKKSAEKHAGIESTNECWVPRDPTPSAEQQSKDQDKPVNRLFGTNSLTDNYKKGTPGQYPADNWPANIDKNFKAVMAEDVFTGDVRGVTIPSFKRQRPDGTWITIPGHTIKKRVKRKIIDDEEPS